MAAIGGSMMVSYTRARAEGLGVILAGGTMQRAERIVLIAGGTLIAAWFASADIVGVMLALYGVASMVTALHRGIVAYRALARRGVEPVRVAAVRVAREPAAAPVLPLPIPDRNIQPHEQP
jgi:hypothetical protein